MNDYGLPCVIFTRIRYVSIYPGILLDTKFRLYIKTQYLISFYHLPIIII
jgi:hypothetical protein